MEKAWDTLHALEDHARLLIQGFRALNNLYDDVTFSTSIEERKVVFFEIEEELRSLEEHMNIFDKKYSYLFRNKGISKLLKNCNLEDDDESLEELKASLVNWIGLVLEVEHVISGQRKKFEDMKEKEVADKRTCADREGRWTFTRSRTTTI